MPRFRSVDEALQAMARGETEVSLRYANIGDAGARRVAEALASNTTIKKLYLTDNFIGVEGVRELAEALKTNTSLRELGLSNNSVGVEGVRELAEALNRNTGLRKLFLLCNRIGDEGTQQLAEVLQFNSNLQELYLGDNGIGDPGARALLEAMACNSRLTKLCLYDNWGIKKDLKQEIQTHIQRNKERCIILQVSTMPSVRSEADEDKGLDVAVTKMSGEQVFNQPLQPETTLGEVAVQVAELCGVPVEQLRWVLPRPRTVGSESLHEPLLQLLQGGPVPAEQ